MGNPLPRITFVFRSSCWCQCRLAKVTMLSVRSLQQVWVVFAQSRKDTLAVHGCQYQRSADPAPPSPATGIPLQPPPQIVLAVKSTNTYARSRAYAQERKRRRMSSRSNTSQPAILLMPVSADNSRATHFPLELDGGPGYRRVLRLRKR